MALFFVASRLTRGDFHRRYPPKPNPVHEGSCKIMDIGETIYVTSRTEWRRWLEKNHASRDEIWLVQYKKATKKPSINYLDAVEEAICFGWIDSFEKSMDSERYSIRFSPRRSKSKWTETNMQRARKMEADGKMTDVGRAKLPPDMKE